MKIKISNDGIIEYYNNRIGYVKNGIAVVDEMFKKNEVEEYLTEQNSIPIEWKNNVYSALINGSVKEETILTRNCRIYQLKSACDVCMKFIGYNELKSKGYGEPDISNYDIVFDGNAGTEILDNIFLYFQNISSIEGYSGHRMMISDVIELYDDNTNEFYYVDKHNMIRLHSFKPEMSPVSNEIEEVEKVSDKTEENVLEANKSGIDETNEGDDKRQSVVSDEIMKEPSKEDEEFRVETFTITM